MEDITTETGTEMLVRLAKKQPLKGLLPDVSPLAAGHVLEVTGEPGTGKTELLMQFVVQCLLPKVWDGIELEGNNCGVLMVDTDHHFDLFRLATILESRARQRLSLHLKRGRMSLDVGLLVRDCLRRLLIVPCYSSSQLLVTLPSLASILSAHSDISLLLIDSISAFYWPDRVAATDKYDFVYPCRRAVTMALQNLVTDFGLVVIATRQHLFQRRKAHDVGQEMQHLEKEWQRIIKSRLHLQVMTVCSGNTEVQCVCSCKDWRQERKFTIGATGIEWQ